MEYMISKFRVVCVMDKTILVIEDEEDISDIIIHYIKMESQ